MSSFFSIGEDDLDLDDEVNYTLMYFTIIFFLPSIVIYLNKCLISLICYSLFFSTIIIFFSRKWLKHVQIKKATSVLFST